MDRLVTVFGGSGFVGNAVVRALARDGWRIRVGMRRPHLGYKLRLLGNVGQIELVQANIRSRASVAAALEEAEAAINLVGVLYETGGQTFEALHAKAPGMVARLAAERGIERFVQMSALGADARSRSAYARSKAEGETGVRAAIPGAVVMRPSVIFGPEDAFFNRFAALAANALVPALPLVGGGRTRFQPVYVGDVARAVAAALDDAGLAGQTYELGGPHTYTFRELMELVLAETGRKKPLIPLPFGAADMIGKVGDLQARILPIAPQLTSDQVALLRTDNVVSGRQPGLEAFGVAPTAAEAVVPSYLWRYRKGGQFADITPQGFISHRQHG